MKLNFANKVTIGRILVVPLFIATVLYYSPQRDFNRYWALGILILAVGSDVFDGYIARSRKERTRAGAILDPLADKLLLISAFVCLYAVGPAFPEFRFPIWLVVSVISREIILVLGALIIQLINGEFEIEPSFWGKATNFLQVCCIIGMLLQWEFSMSLWFVTVIATVISGLGYIGSGIKILNGSHT